MAPPLNPECNKMLHAPVLLDGPRKNAIDALQKQIDFHFGEINKLRSAQNSHVPISGLPAELLSEVFLCIIESGIQDGEAWFGIGTFIFRQVCRHWNEVAVRFPQLWVRWPASSTEAWPLFNARSKGAPLFLTWRPCYPSDSCPDVLKDPALPGRVRQLYFSGSSEQLGQLIDGFGSSSPINVSSLRLGITFRVQGHLACVLPFSFPKLSRLQIGNFQPDSSSPIFTTSNLTSLNLSFHDDTGLRYTLAQLSRILQKHPNLRELDLKDGATPQAESPEAPVPCVLPRLADLKLHSTPGRILGLINLIGMSSPLHNVVLHFRYPRDPTVPALVDAVKKILAAYYECKGLDHSRKADCLTVELRSRGLCDPLTFVARSHSPPTSNPQPILKLQFSDSDKLSELLSLFPLDDVQEFTADGLKFSSDEYCTVLQRMKGLLHLSLTELDFRPVLEVINSYDPDEPYQPTIPKLVSLTLSYIDLLHGVGEDTLTVLERRRHEKFGLERLVVESCRVHLDEEESGFSELVEEVEWNDVEAVGLYYDGTDEADSDDLDYYERMSFYDLL